jgi:hypothetical protein
MKIYIYLDGEDSDGDFSCIYALIQEVLNKPTMYILGKAQHDIMEREFPYSENEELQLSRDKELANL